MVATVLVTISLRYGGPHRNVVKVATVRVSPDAPVQVNELRDYGVEPITLSLVTLVATIAHAPVAVSVSAQAEVRAEPVDPNASAYRVAVTSKSALPLMWFQTYRGDRRTISGRERGSRNLPVVMPGSEYTFELTSYASRKSPDSGDVWEPQDRIELTSLMWQDGLVEGAPAVLQGRFDASKAAQLRALLTRLRGGGQPSIASLRPEIARSMSFDPETRQFRDSLLADLDSLERTRRSSGGQNYETWLAGTITKCQQWLSRIVLPKS